MADSEPVEQKPTKGRGRPKSIIRLMLTESDRDLLRAYLGTRKKQAEFALEKAARGMTPLDRAYAEPVLSYWLNVISAINWLISTLPKPVDDPRE